MLVDHKETLKHRGWTEIRRLTPDHILQLCELYDEEWPSQTRTKADMKQAVEGADFVVGIIERQTDSLIGFCRVVSDGGFRAWIHGLVVRKPERGIGLGKLIMDQVLASPELKGFHSVGLTCAPAMVPFYEKWDFTVRDDEVVMNLNLRG